MESKTRVLFFSFSEGAEAEGTKAVGSSKDGPVIIVAEATFKSTSGFSFSTEEIFLKKRIE